MSLNHVRKRPSRLLAALTAGVLAVGASVIAASPATAAAAGDVSGASLSWGFKSSWRGYVAGFGGAATAADGATSSESGYTWGSGSGTRGASGSVASVEYPGSITWSVPAHGITKIELSDLVIAIDAAGAGTITADYDYSTTSSASGTDVIATFTAGTPTDANGVLTYSNVAVSGTARLTEMFGSSYGSGTALDPMTFAFPYESAPVQQATTTSLSAPASAVEGSSVTFTATVAPAAAGTVTFAEGGSTLGTAPTNGSGVATYSTSGLSAANHSVVATFVPTDGAAYSGSASSAQTVTITAAEVPLTATTTTIAPQSPARPAPATAPVVLGAAASISATVTAAAGTPTGAVEFFGTAAGAASPVSIGSATLVNGTATITPKLAAGGTIVTASFNPTGAFAASTSAAAQTYRTVDTSTTSVCTPSTLATTSNGATASWGMSEYSNAWSKTATGDVAVDDELFEFTGGQVTADADCARVEFDGSLTVLPYPGMSPAAFTLSDPVLTVSRSGAGNWTAQMTTDSSATPKRVTFATFSGVSGLPTAGADGGVTIVPAYAGAVAAGTWSGTYSDSWPNGFVIEVPADIRAFFYLSGTTAAQLTKPPAPVELAFAWPAAAVEPGTDEPGTDVPGTDEPVVIPPAAQPAEQEQCVARSVSGASLTWGVKQSFRSYVTGSIAHGSVELSGVAENGGDYRWTGGSGSVNVADAAGRIAFDGTVRFTGHDGQLDLTIRDPRVIMTGSTGVLVADVFSKSLQGPDVDAAGVALATLDLSDVSTSGSRVTGSAVPATLTENGAKAFGGFYSAGTALDSVAFTAPLGAEVACDSYSDTKLASTGVRGELLFGGAAILLLLGAALVVARRRRSSIA